MKTKKTYMALRWLQAAGHGKNTVETLTDSHLPRLAWLLYLPSALLGTKNRHACYSISLSPSGFGSYLRGGGLCGKPLGPITPTKAVKGVVAFCGYGGQPLERTHKALRVRVLCGA